MSLLDVVGAYLRHRDVPHAIIGAAALALHGVSRSTFDQDLLVVDPRVLTPAFWGAFEPGAHVETKRGDPDDPLAGVVRIQAGNERDVDLVVGRHTWQSEMLARAEPIPDGGGLSVVRAADLVLLKLYAGGSQDRWDIEQLLALDPAQTIVQEVEGRLALLPDRSVVLWRRLLAGT